MFKSNEELIAEIHNEFDTAQDRLLAEAKRILSVELPSPEPAKEQQAERLKRLGFTKAALVAEVEETITKRKEKETALVSDKEQASTIEYYKTTYPFLKFLTENELERICNKYDLIFAPVSHYKGNIPDKNIRDIENAQPLQNSDIVGGQIELIPSRYSDKKLFMQLMGAMGKKNAIFSQSEINDWCKKANGRIVEDWCERAKNNTWLYTVNNYLFASKYDYNYESVIFTDRGGLFIAAPESEFDLDGLKRNVKGFFKVFETKVEDPIVFRYVNGGVQVLTKWGTEASDPSLLLPINN